MSENATSPPSSTARPHREPKEGHGNNTCIDNKGKSVPNGVVYAPNGPDVCQLCSCINGRPAYCWTVLCAPPPCDAIRVQDRCCEWFCVDEMHGVRLHNGGPRIPTVTRGQGFDRGANGGSGYINFNVNNMGGHSAGVDIGLRLVASSVTAILSLCLLFFLIYRLRRRRARHHSERVAAMATASVEQRDGDADGRSVDSVPEDPEADGMPTRGPRFFYSAWWKPPAFFEGRTAPPTYEDAVAYDGATSRVVRRPPSDRDEDGGFSSDSGSDAPPYSEIGQDPVIIHPASSEFDVATENQRHRQGLGLPPSAALVLPCPAPPLSQLHHVEQAAKQNEQINTESTEGEEVRETFTAEV